MVGIGPLCPKGSIQLVHVGGGKHGGFEEERKPVDLAGNLILKLREYSFPREGSQVPRNSDLCAQGV